MKNNNNYNYEETANNVLNNNSDDLFIQNLNIESHLKNEKYINELLCSNTFDNIFEYIKEIYNNNNFNIDLIKYGLFLLNEKILNLENETKNALNEYNFINIYNFKEIIMLLLVYSKNENKKIEYDPNILKLTYELLANFCYFFENNEEIKFLLSEKFLELHIYFFDITSDKDTIKNILLMIYNLCYDDDKIINEILTFNNNSFFKLLIEYINNYQQDNEINEIILDLFIYYINIFNDDNKSKTKKQNDDIIEMKDKTINCDFNIIETIYEIILLLIHSTQNSIFSNSLYIISVIIKIIYKSNNFELMSKIINNNNLKAMLLLILEKDYKNYTENLIYMSDVMKYLIKMHSKSFVPNDLKLNFIHLINDIEQNLSENDEIIDIFIYFLTNKKIKIKEKIKIKLVEALSSLIFNDFFFKNIIENHKEDLLDVIINYINSSNYNIRKKIIKIVELLTNKRDFILADYLVKNKILYYIKNAIDPNITYCHDEKIILGALKIIDNLLSIGEIFKKLHGINSVLVNFENIGGKELLENLLCNKYESVYNFSQQIIDRYFN
jgi:hypothetical protein